MAEKEINEDRVMTAPRTVREGPGTHRKPRGMVRRGQVVHFTRETYQLRNPGNGTQRAGDTWKFTPGKPGEYPEGWISTAEKFDMSPETWRERGEK